MFNFFRKEQGKKIRVWEDEELEKQKTRINMVSQFSEFLKRDKYAQRDYKDISHCIKAIVEDSDSNLYELSQYLVN